MERGGERRGARASPHHARLEVDLVAEHHEGEVVRIAQPGLDQELVILKLLYGNDRCHLVAVHDINQVDDRAPSRGTNALRDSIHLQPVTVPFVGEKEDVIVRRRDKQVLDEILILRVHAGYATPTPVLTPIRVDRNPLM